MLLNEPCLELLDQINLNNPTREHEMKSHDEHTHISRSIECEIITHLAFKSLELQNGSNNNRYCNESCVTAISINTD